MALRVAALRRHGVILLYHRVTPQVGTRDCVVPTVTTTRFREQIEALQGVGDLVPLDALRTPSPRARVRIALTFDDDERSHVTDVLPVLQTLGAPATFFLCGRTLHGFGAPWWVLLEGAVARLGIYTVAGMLGVDAHDAPSLARLCEGTPLAETVARTFAHEDHAPLLAEDDFRALADTGMGIGFHTVGHPVLPALGDHALASALGTGRDALQAATGAAIDTLAYPHGRADARVAGAARRAGYAAGYRTGARPVAPGVDPWWLARWEPGDVDPTTLRAHLALRVNLPAAPRP